MAGPHSVEPDNGEPPEIDTSKPHPARVYDYLLGGKDNISQVVSGLPYRAWTAAIQALHENFSKTVPLTVSCLPGPCMGFMSGFPGGHS